MASKLTLRQQITFLGVSLVVLTVASLLAVSMWKTISSHNLQINQRIKSAENVLIEYLKAKEELLLTASKVLTADFGFKQAVASRDQATIASVLQNHGSRINASLMVLSDLNGEIISSSNNQLTFDSTLSQSLMAIKQNLNKTQLMLLGDSLYQLIILPVEAPRTIAYSVIGFQIDQAFVDELKRLMTVEVSFIYNDALIISTLQNIDASHKEHFKKTDNSWLLFERKLYENKLITFTDSQYDKYVAQLSVNLSPSYIELDKLVAITLLISFFIIGITAIVCSFIARSLTKPLHQLTQLSHDFARGKYKHNTVISDGGVEVLRVYNSFIQMGKKIEQREIKINYQAKHDALTDVYNRATFLELLAEKITLHDHNTDGSLLLMAINVRNFKRINDSLGTGDITLRSIVQRIKAIYPEQTLMVGRFSGTEFGVLINLKNNESYEDIIEHFLPPLRAPLKVNKLWLNLNYCVGTCLFPEQSSNAKALVRRTTIALEAAKTENSTLRAYQSGEDEAYLERLSLLEELRETLARDDGGLFMVYQPKLNLENGKIEKVESLIRWIKPNKQFVSPELFIDLAEQSGLIIKLTHWVIDTVFRQQQEWRAKNLKLKVAINISAQDIINTDFIDFIFEKISQYHVDPKLVTLEITERDIMTNEDLVINRLTQLKQTGIQISVDDYGIGQSSLGKLKQLPIDELKIDKAFILELDTSEKDQYIVQSTIELSHQLGFSVVAEGVENKASLDMLKAMKCNHAQGYFISRPIKSAELLIWLNAYE
ncbi:EAL domain-containing protein [Colwellia sp. MB02u-6]|uniref:putative bifunctional diguanylate cyclase/phosphodiesterase n=1 Tax=Colwellia sp. MB02u-6 TaxID=2759824 RepID=UPI0015F52AB6|nr:EAL domain-containing protein [Colwellia sp. MB02u-6]MBA6327483.1 EAL domain-containing protein [Colwellia sp. MB02u-6]